MCWVPLKDDGDHFDWCFPQDDYDSYDSDYPYNHSYLPHVQGQISMVRRDTRFCTLFGQLRLTFLFIHSCIYFLCFFDQNRRCDNILSLFSPVATQDPDIHAHINLSFVRNIIGLLLLLWKFLTKKLNINKLAAWSRNLLINVSRKMVAVRVA